VVSRTRDRVLAVVRSAGWPVAVEDIAVALGLGLNTVRHHLGALEADGQIAAGLDRRGGRGRPRLVYRFRPAPAGPYELLALALLRARRTGEPPEEAGRALAPEGDDVVAFLAAEGFDPQPADGGGVRLAACPLAAGAAVDPAAVCGVHRGMVGAIAARRGQRAELVVGPPGTCRVEPRPDPAPG